LNYYEHHIGDYAEATAHLNFVEDAAYSRCIRKYYATERPLPTDLKDVQRLVGARTRDERAAVETVLREFFTLEDDGWHQKRCDSDIHRFHEKQGKARASANVRWAERNANAMRTHSEGTAKEGSERNANASKTHDGRNALQSPVTSHQTNTGESARKRTQTSPDRPDDVDLQVWLDWTALRKAKRAPVSPTVVEGARGEAAKAGMTFEAFLRVWCRRGTQGLEAAWLKPEERQSETPGQRAARERIEAIAPGVAARNPATTKPLMEVVDVTTRRLG
jgi:uncharacterized protein YdaU (DUF1376 family)